MSLAILLLLQCFNHFSLYLKGREELVVTVYHGDASQYRPPPLARITLAGYVCACRSCLHRKPASQPSSTQANTCASSMSCAHAQMCTRHSRAIPAASEPSNT